MEKIWFRAALGAAFVIAVSAAPALAIPVQTPFGSDSFAKAILFTSAGKPTSTSNGATRNIFAGNTASRLESGAVMTPLGDGSYICTAAIFPGAQYTYFFSTRIREYDFAAGDSRASWDTTPPNDARTTADEAKAKTISIPTTATNGYYIYNAHGDRSVIGYQGPTNLDTIHISNPFLAQFGGNTLIAALNAGDTFTRISTTGDTLYANYDGENVYGIDAVQTGDSAFTISWEYTAGMTAFVQTIDGARRFGAAGGTGGTPLYGYQIWRCDSPTGGINGAVFINRTAAITGGDTNWSDNNSSEWDATTSVTDATIPDTVTNFLYLITWRNAYGYLQNDTTRQNFSGGYDTVSRSAAIRVFFIVEHFNEDVVFPNGATHGQVYVTPVIDGVRRPDLRHREQAILVRRNQATI